ncbi:MAG: alpha/beta fold hydrolase [Alphaproteobacteria bacterium]|nr:alpha/beta fold hydrolase [Alphaproteobacteria bacterium]
MGTTIDCEFTIEGSGPPLLLIHGIGAARDAWRFMVPALSEHFTVVTYDLRGHGTSPLPVGEFGLDELVDDLERVRERAGIERAHIAGHSLGGMIGPAYARRYPRRVLSLALLSTAAGRSEEDSARVRAVVRAMEEDGIAPTLDTLVDRWFTDDFIDRKADIVARRLKQVLATDAAVFMNVFRIYAGTEMAPWLHEIEARSLVLTGELDGGCNPRLNRFIADRLPDAELVILSNLKHAILLEAPGDVTSHLVRFIGA